MSQVFISYSRRDLDFVTHLVKTLEAVQIDNWLDQEDIEPAADWRARIQAGIESADNFIFVISPTSVKSAECLKELEIAQQNGKRLIPIVYKEVDPKLTHPALAALNWIFFREGIDDFQTSFTKLVEAIKTDLTWAHAHSRIQTRALEWKRKNQDTSFLLRGKDLLDAEQHMAEAGPDKDPQTTELQRQYVLASRQDTSRRQQRNFILVSIALVLVFGLAIVAFFLRGVANREADANATAQVVAEDAKETAISERDLKSTAQVHAENAEATAVAERDIALSRQLAAQAQVLATEQLDLALLLAIEASHGTTDGKLSLTNLLQAEPHLIRIVSGPKGYLWQGSEVGFVSDLVLSLDGIQLVAGSYEGASFWDLNSLQFQDLDPVRLQQYLDDWAPHQILPPEPDTLLQTLDIYTLIGASSATPDRAAFSACRTIPAAGGAPGCASLIYIFAPDFERLITPLPSCSPHENERTFQIELEGGLYRIEGLPNMADFELYSVALANKASNYGSRLVDALYDPQMHRLITAAAVERHGSELALIVWDLGEKKPILELYYPLWDTLAADIIFSNGGETLDVCVYDAGVQIDISPGSWQAQTCEITGRNFTRNEWQQYFPDERYRLTCHQWPAGE